MSHTATSARDAVLNVINVAWLASGITSTIGILWDDVEVTEKELSATRFDVNGNALPYARGTARTLVSNQETLGPVGVAKYLTEGLLVVQVFTPPGDGNELADSIMEVLKTATRGVSVGALWFFNVVPNEVGIDKQWNRHDFRASYRYEEK